MFFVSRSTIGIAAGAIVGGLVVLAIIIIVVYYRRHEKKRKAQAAPIVFVPVRTAVLYLHCEFITGSEIL